MVDVVLTAAVSTLFGASLVWYLVHRPRNFESTAKKSDNRFKESPQSLHKLVEATHGTSGETFFYAMVRELSRYLSIDAVFIGGVVDARQQSFRSLAYWSKNGYVMNQAISLLHGPDGDASNICYFENSVAQLFPNNSLFQEPFEAAAFFSVKLQDSSGKQIGILAGLHQSDRRVVDGELDVIRMFAARSAAELERKLALSESLMEKERAQITLHSIGDGVITTDSIGAIDYMNPAAEALTGWRFHQAMGLSMDSVLHLEDEQSGQRIPDPALHCLSEKRVIAPKTDNVLVSRDGERYSIQGTAAPMIDSENHCIGVVLVFKDVTDSRRMQKMMVHQATHDPLTGLVNRSEFEDRLEQALVSAKDFENTHALLFLDLDQFKIVNDSAGHVAGDELLKQISVLLAGQLRGRDTLGRLGGDEFSVLLENCPLSKAKKVADMLIEAIR
ncbi:MAG: diguanylate cyclase, partial [Pseudomonadota bacterium]